MDLLSQLPATKGTNFTLALHVQSEPLRTILLTSSVINATTCPHTLFTRLKLGLTLTVLTLARKTTTLLKMESALLPFNFSSTGLGVLFSLW